jgi:hypothetical protein
MKKTLLPNDFRDFLSILSFTGFISIFLVFVFGITIIEENMTGIFLLLGGASFLVVGKVFTIKKWLKDGIQQNEISQLLSIILGFSAMIIGMLFIIGTEIPTKFYGYIGVLALIPAIYTMADYIVKNRK